MTIEITAETYNSWVLALEPLIAEDNTRQTQSNPGGTKRMTPDVVLSYLEHHIYGDHRNDTVEDRPAVLSLVRRIATGETVQLGDEIADDALIAQVIANAERLTGIKAQYPSP